MSVIPEPSKQASTQSLCEVLFYVKLNMAMHVAIQVITLASLITACTAASNQIHRGSTTRQAKQDIHNALEAINVRAVRKQASTAIKLVISQGGSVLQHSGQWVTISWSGVEAPKYDDWIALYVPGTADVTQTAPTKLKYAIDSPSHMTNGSGSLRFKLISYHQDVRFAFMRGGVAAPVHVADSSVLKLANPNEPTQLHLALTSNPSAMSAQWVSWNASTPTVQWGMHPSKLVYSARAKSSRIERDELCGSTSTSVGWVDSGTLHNAEMTGLQPGTRYWYRVGDPAWGWSDVRSFLSPPSPGNGYHPTHPMRPAQPSALIQHPAYVNKHFSKQSVASSVSSNNQIEHTVSASAFVRNNHQLVIDNGKAQHQDYTPTHRKLMSYTASTVEGDHVTMGRSKSSEPSVRVLLLADMGQGESDGSNTIQEGMVASLNTTRWMAADSAGCSLTIHAGDLAYARGYMTLWDNFMAQVEPIASQMPYMTVVGNHERDWPDSGDRFGNVSDSWGECGVPYAKRLAMPTPSLDEMWYSFDHGPIHFLMYSTEHDTAPGSPQYEFFKNDLESVDRSVTPWLVLVGHRPLYVSSSNSLPPDGDQLIAAQLRHDLEPLLIQHKVDLTVHGHHHSYQRTCPMADGMCVGYDEQGRAAGPVHIVIGHAGAGLSLAVQQPTPDYIEKLVIWWGYARMEASRTSLSLQIISDLDGGIMDELLLKK